jgi:lipid-binding SYLF domain-containing protein
MANKLEIGANAGIAVATLGSTVAGATTSNAGADIIVWASSSGAYAGISLAGTVVQPNGDMDAGYYGQSLTSSEIVLGRLAHNPAAAPLVRSLDAL